MNCEYDRYHAPMLPGAVWPDGSRVSNWSQAIAALNLRTSRTRPADVPARLQPATMPLHRETAAAA